VYVERTGRGEGVQILFESVVAKKKALSDTESPVSFLY
jgi:hypothetical protein